MNTTITITPRSFGNIAAAAVANGCDVTTFLIRAATAGAAAPAPAPSTPAPVTAAPAPAPEPAPAPVEEAPELPMLTDDDLPLLTGCY